MLSVIMSQRLMSKFGGIEDCRHVKSVFAGGDEGLHAGCFQISDCAVVDAEHCTRMQWAGGECRYRAGHWRGMRSTLVEG